MVEKRFYSPREAGEILGVSPTTVMDLIHRGRLPAVRVSERIYRIPIPAFDRFVDPLPAPEVEVQEVWVDQLTPVADDARTVDLVQA